MKDIVVGLGCRLCRKFPAKSSQKSLGDFETSLRLGFGSAPVGGNEVLGWWTIPHGLIAGCAMVMVTTLLVLWCVRQYRGSHLLP